MHKYTVHPIQNDNDIFFCVYEEATEQAIDFFFFQEDAEACKTFLENGGAFHGFTPRFMLLSVKRQIEKKSVHEAFKEVFSE